MTFRGYNMTMSIELIVVAIAAAGLAATAVLIGRLRSPKAEVGR